MSTADVAELPPYSSSEQLADFMQVPLDSVKRWRKYGTGPVGTRIGKHVRYARADVAAWLDAQRDTPRPTAPPARVLRRA